MLCTTFHFFEPPCGIAVPQFRCESFCSVAEAALRSFTSGPPRQTDTRGGTQGGHRGLPTDGLLPPANGSRTRGGERGRPCPFLHRQNVPKAVLVDIRGPFSDAAEGTRRNVLGRHSSSGSHSEQVGDDQIAHFSRLMQCLCGAKLLIRCECTGQPQRRIRGQRRHLRGDHRVLSVGSSPASQEESQRSSRSLGPETHSI